MGRPGAPGTTISSGTGWVVCQACRQPMVSHGDVCDLPTSTHIVRERMDGTVDSVPYSITEMYRTIFGLHPDPGEAQVYRDYDLSDRL